MTEPDHLDGPPPAWPDEAKGTRSTERVLSLLPASEFLEPLPIAWAVNGVLELDSVAEVSGGAGSMKTFLVLGLACSIATGQPWCGRAVVQGPVLLFIGEGRAGFRRRLPAWEIAHGISLTGAPLFVSSHAAALTGDLGPHELLAVISDFIAMHGAPVLIVFDTLNRNFGPADENSTSDMTAAVGILDQLREMTGACIVVVHHTGHGDKTRGRGSSVLFGALDAAYLVERDEDGTVRATARKMKDADLPEPMAFRPRVVDLGVTDENGEPVTSVVLSPVSWSPPPQKGKSCRGKHQTTAMRVLRDEIERHRANVAKSGRDPDQAKVSLDAWRTACGEAKVDRRRFSEVSRSLSDAGMVSIRNGYVFIPDDDE